MIYTLRKGVDDRPERIQSYMLRALPIVVAAMIAIVGAFTQLNNSSSESNNQEPLAIYTEPASDFGSPTNPQGNGNNPGDASVGRNTGSNGVPQAQSRLKTIESENSSNITSDAVLPIGGSGGDSDCPCRQLQETVSTEVSTITGALPPIAPVPALP